MYSFKKIFEYVCSDCKKKRTTIKPEKVKRSVCGKCLSHRVPEGQQSLFGEKAVEKVDKSLPF